MSDTLRAFIAVELPEAAVLYAMKVQEVLKTYRFKARWIPPENMHLTLKFLGDIVSGDAEKIGEALGEAARNDGPIRLAAGGLGGFPGIKKPRVIWCGLKGDTEALVRLQSRLDALLSAFGFPKGKRVFQGHLTLGRVKGGIDPKKMLDAVKEIGTLDPVEFTADTITLFRSDLKPSGAVYTKLIQVAL